MKLAGGGLHIIPYLVWDLHLRELSLDFSEQCLGNMFLKSSHMGLVVEFIASH